MARARKFAEARDTSGKAVIQFMCPAAENDALSVALRILTHQLQLKTGKDGGGGFGGQFGYGLDFENDVFLMTPDYQDVECACGHGAEIDAWHQANPHAPDCYQTKVYDGRLDDQTLEAEWEAALSERSRHEWNSPQYAMAQKRVVAASDARDKHRVSVLRSLCREHHIPWNGGKASMVHCTCAHDAAATLWSAAHEHAERCPVVIPNFWHKETSLKVRWYKYIGRDMEASAGTTESLHTVLADCLASIGAPSVEEAVEAYAHAEEQAAADTERAMDFWFSDEGRRLTREMMDSGAIKIGVIDFKDKQ
jgi:hypothetical protein